MKRNLLNISLIILVILLFSSCADVVCIDKCIPIDAKVYGFWNGLWHGMTSGITFISSLFTDNVTVYAINNNGAWYNFGFLWGVAGALGSTKTKKVYHYYKVKRNNNQYITNSHF